MRTIANGTELKAAAYAGTYVVVLAWDTLNGQQPHVANLLGFGIERSELDAQGKVVERYWLRGIKRFKSKDKGLAPGTPVSTAEHPIQGFLWADYTAHAATRYRYRVVPIRGTVKNAAPDDAASVTLELTSEPEYDQGPDDGATRHDVFFNRGVIGSQAYAREFDNRTPDADDPESPEMKWLSRGLYEALIGFIGRAGDQMKLRAAFYEFQYLPVANAFATAIEAGADVKIVYDAVSKYKIENEETLHQAGLLHDGIAIGRTVSEGIRHNKFIVLLDGDDPVAVFTGSTNISAGGIFGHSNVGHIVWDKDVAAKYLQYWELLARDLTPAKLRLPNQEITPMPEGKPPEDSVTPIFSARDKPESNDTLQWYADLLGGAKEVSCMTFAFNIDQAFQEVLSEQNDVLRYVVKDDPLGASESVGQDRDVIFAAGGYLAKDSVANFLAERSNPLNSNDYIHNKFMLVDPLSEDPLVVTGSANFSKPSQRTNDENMLVIRGNKRVADIYFGEFMRVFDHHYSRYVVKLLKGTPGGDPNAGYLKELSSQWLPAHFNSESYKAKRRKYFAAPSD